MSSEYDVYIDGEKLGLGLSKGELNQWLLELHAELKSEVQVAVFEEGFGCNSENFEDYLYETDLSLPKVVDFGESVLVVEKHNPLDV